ncbi:MAG: protein kinase [Gemmataceae bacterium]|nr:protein kinase [Gemmataceae bacterium]
MSSADDPMKGPTGTFQQFVPPQPGRDATLTFARVDSGPQPAVQSRMELIALIHRCKEGLEPPLVSGYKPIRELGSGAYGTVWEAENTETGERVAIKFFLFSRHSTGDVLEEVTNLRDAEGCYGIITVKQVNRHGIAPHHIPNYVMSLEAGGSLHKKIESGQLTAEDSVRIFRQLLRAMSFVHSRGLLHCDLKPANVLLNRAGEPVVADFGQAQRASSTVAALGTFFYMAPEQATRQPRNPCTQSDVYALGAILYTMLTGKPPRHDEAFLAKLREQTDVDETLEQYRQGLKDLPKPEYHKTLVDPMLAQLIDRALDLDPEKRPDDAGDLLRLLNRRDWWIRTKPVVTVGTVATAVAIALLIGLSIAAGNFVLRRSKADITREIQGSLLRDAWFGKQAVDSKFRERIDFLEDSAAEECPAAIRQALADAAKRVGAGADPAAVLRDLDRVPFDRWIKERHNEMLLREDVGGWKALGLILVANRRGYYLNRVKTDGSIDNRDVPEVRHVYSKDWSFRDYFNGVANDFAGENQPHDPVRHTHISHAYRSRADHRPWLVDISTPIYDRPDGEVVALLVSGFNVNDDLRRWIETPKHAFPKEMTIASEVRSVMVNDRGTWVWHEDGMDRLGLSDTPRDPEPYLVDTPEGLRFPTTDGPGDPLARGISANHRDSAAAPENRSRTYLAAYEELKPYSQSRYDRLRERDWHLVVKLDAETALKPVEDLKQKMQWAGSILFLGLLGLTVTLWVWLIRLLRRQEFANHG